jgi:hypothetical protein
LIGGAFALVGGWYSLKLQKEDEARGLAGALAAELTTAERMMEGGVVDLYTALLDGWKATGQVIDRQVLVDLFDNQPQDSLPVYYSMAGKLGLLPAEIASRVVEYHALIVGLQRTIVRFLGKRELGQQTVKGLAASIEAQWNRSSTLRAALITDLSAIATKDPRVAGFTGGRRRLLVLGFTLALILADIALLTSGHRVLVWQHYVAAGQPQNAQGFKGSVADAPSIECWYFTGRSIRSTPYWYSPNNVMGKDECPFIE